MGEREIRWGESGTAQWRTGDDATSGNFVVAEDLDAQTVLWEYDTTANEWVSRGGVNMSSNPISNVSTLGAQTVEAEQRTLAGETRERVAGPTDFAGGTFDVSGLESFDRIEVIFRAEGDDNPSEIHLQINNDTSSSYEYREFDGGSLQTTTGDTKIRVADVGDFHQVSGRLILYDAFSVRESPAVTAEIGSLVSLRTLESGYRQTFDETSSLQLINTNGNAAEATATVWGITDF